jgi:hypothetical protein
MYKVLICYFYAHVFWIKWTMLSEITAVGLQIKLSNTLPLQRKFAEIVLDDRL